MKNRLERSYKLLATYLDPGINLEYPRGGGIEGVHVVV